MTTNRAAVDLPASRPVGQPGRVGQSTAVEQSRAVAEVQAAVIVAHERPRNETVAAARMREACARPTLAKRAFYRMPRADGTVTGPSIHLARELARIWGNVQYGIAELDRDTHAGGRSEMLARAWDLESNTLVTSGFIVPHSKDKGSLKKGTAEVVQLVQLDAVYENNANNGARRVRECIKAVLPLWFWEEAQDICRATIEGGDGTPLHQRVEQALVAFRDGYSVRQDQLERKVGKPAARWSAHDVADLEVVYLSLRRGEVTVAEEFPPAGVTAADIEARAQSGTRSVDKTGDDSGPDNANARASPAAAADTPADPDKERRWLFAILGKLGLSTDAKRDDRLAVLSALTQRPIGSSDDLTAEEVQTAAGTLDAITRQRDEQERALSVGELVTDGRAIRAAATKEQS